MSIQQNLQRRISNVDEIISPTSSFSNKDHHLLFQQLEDQIKAQNFLITSLGEQIQRLEGRGCCVDTWVKRQIQEMTKEEEDNQDDDGEWLNAIPIFRGDGCATRWCFDAFVEWLETVLESVERESEVENGEDIRARYEDYIEGGYDHGL